MPDQYLVWYRSGHTVQYLRHIAGHVYYFTEDKAEAKRFSRAKAGRLVFDHNFEARRSAIPNSIPCLYSYTIETATVYPD